MREEGNGLSSMFLVTPKHRLLQMQSDCLEQPLSLYRISFVPHAPCGISAIHKNVAQWLESFPSLPILEDPTVFTKLSCRHGLRIVSCQGHSALSKTQLCRSDHRRSASSSIASHS